MINISENISRERFWNAFNEYFTMGQRAFFEYVYKSQLSITGLHVQEMYCNLRTFNFLVEHPVYAIKHSRDPYPYTLSVDESIPDYHVGIEGVNFYFDFKEFYKRFLKEKGIG